MGKRWLVLLLSLLCLAGIVSVMAAEGTEDPLLSVSYLYNTYLPKLQELFSGESETRFRALSEDYGQRLDRLDLSEGSPWSRAAGYTAMEMEDGGSLRLAPFGRFLFTEGSAMLHIPAGEVLDLSEGRPCTEGEMLLPGHRYFAVEESEAVIRAYAPSAGFADGNYVLEPSGSFSASEQFLDVAGHWGREKILIMAEAGLVNGMEAHRFEPNRKVTRAMFVTVLGRYSGITDGSAAEASFPDVREGDWFAPYVGWGAGIGLVQGYDDGSFGPNLEITREQMALILVRYCRAMSLVLPEQEGKPFLDEEQISFWASDSVHQARRWGLVNGREDGSFDPKGTATRAEMCTIICNLMDRSGAAAAGREGPEAAETEGTSGEEEAPASAAPEAAEGQEGDTSAGPGGNGD